MIRLFHRLNLEILMPFIDRAAHCERRRHTHMCAGYFELFLGIPGLAFWFSSLFWRKFRLFQLDGTFVLSVFFHAFFPSTSCELQILYRRYCVARFFDILSLLHTQLLHIAGY